MTQTCKVLSAFILAPVASYQINRKSSLPFSGAIVPALKHRIHQNSAVTRAWARVVLGWVTSWEVLVLHPSCLLRLSKPRFSTHSFFFFPRLQHSARAVTSSFPLLRCRRWGPTLVAYRRGPAPPSRSLG